MQSRTHWNVALSWSCPTRRTCVTLQGPYPSVVEDFQLHPLCNSMTKLADAWSYHLWGRIKSYFELHLLHILGFNIEIMNGLRGTCLGWRFVEDESGLWAVCHI